MSAAGHVDSRLPPQDALAAFEALLASSPIGFALLDRELRYVRVNAPLAALNGPTVAEHLGRRVEEVLPPDQSEPVAALLRSVFETGEALNGLEVRIEAPAGSGHVRELVGWYTPVRDERGAVRWVAATVVDVTERTTDRDAATAAQHRAEVRARALVEQSPLPMLVYDADGRVLTVNPAATAAFGFRLADLPADYSVLADAQLERDGLLPYVRRAYAGEAVSAPPTRYDLRTTTATGAGGAFWVQFHFYPIRDAAGAVEQVVLTAIDVTALKEAETALRESQEQLLTAQRLDAVGRLAGGVAHEVNNALQGVLGFGAFALQSLAPGDPVRGDVEQMLRSGERASRIAQQLLAFSRRQVLQPEPLDVHRVVAEFAPMLRQALGPERELTVAPAAGPAVAHADRGQLEQVLLNLALNARDAMPQGGRLAVAVEGATPDGRAVRFTVADTGVGMDEATRERIFEPFFTTKPVGQGSGLGLAVVHGIVEQSGGWIRCESRPGEGTRFTLELPAAAGGAAAAPVHANTSTPPPAAGVVTVLVVDDEAAVRLVARRGLEELGYAVLEAEDGRAALAVLAERTVDVVLTDLVMPNLGGADVGRAVRRQWPHVAVVYMSGYTGDVVVRDGLVSADARFLQKPFQPDSLQRIVAEALA